VGICHPHVFWGFWSGVGVANCDYFGDWVGGKYANNALARRSNFAYADIKFKSNPYRVPTHMKMTNHILEMVNAAGFRTRVDLRPML